MASHHIAFASISTAPWKDARLGTGQKPPLLFSEVEDGLFPGVISPTRSCAKTASASLTGYVLFELYGNKALLSGSPPRHSRLVEDQSSFTRRLLIERKRIL
ncbi:hypothetical protein PGQ11_011186 [Apiospora arundinis]|uniref:Uncharacterized protein n=1 Tax=Apiospora arundinis TaxID=335852 RepID=A0ABR2HYU6_9PEZI